MKLPRPRFTVRWMMVAVAVVGCGLGLGKLWHRHNRFQQVADDFAQRENWVAGQLAVLPESFPENMSFAKRKKDERGVKFVWADSRRIDYYCHMRMKYERAARYPWLYVETDPPEPELSGMGGL